jgi:hypothetical protein
MLVCAIFSLRPLFQDFKLDTSVRIRCSRHPSVLHRNLKATAPLARRWRASWLWVEGINLALGFSEAQKWGRDSFLEDRFFEMAFFHAIVNVNLVVEGHFRRPAL